MADDRAVSHEKYWYVCDCERPKMCGYPGHGSMHFAQYFFISACWFVAEANVFGLSSAEIVS